MTDFISALKELSCDVEIKENEPLSLHSTFKIGGPARYFTLPATEEQFIAVLRAVKTSGERYIIIGNGSNILFSDHGFNGVVVSTCSMKDVSADGNKITALCGASVIRT
ncbi:MAG: FAD-binding protein, partial [Clostridia bacterium]|nr:FAD-binding protein [Clostridia bacterium]